MRILVTFALEQEFAAWRRLRGFRKKAAQPPRYEARLGDAQVRVVLTGMGPQHARRAMQAALAEPADVCIVSGLAGGLNSCHLSGEVLVARTVLGAAGANCEASDPDLLVAAVAAGAREVSAFRSVERLVLSAREKARLASSADAVDMESATICAQARAAGIRAVAVRVVGDTVEQELPLDFENTAGADGSVSVSRVLGELMRHPARLPAVVRLGRQTQRAAARLAAFLDAYVVALAAGKPQREWMRQAVAG